MLVVAAMLGDQCRPDSACGAAQEASSGMSFDSLHTILICQLGSVSDLRHIQLPVRRASVSMVPCFRVTCVLIAHLSVHTYVCSFAASEPSMICA